ncbi:helix-turn-helix domain-containing protein [Nocardioides speluncae]|uniref:helix-turn-helix domain-containing protein n=1 Tax=Nocardioides speluncae TaxID=2670337 RepID=UPI000D690633|nr:helix-turn-helix transcriptional regulator [Nocardioides speluncae]
MGRPPADLDPAQIEVLALLAEGHTIDGIARRLDVSERTVRRRLRMAADTMGASSMIEAVVRAVRGGVI